MGSQNAKSQKMQQRGRKSQKNSPMTKSRSKSRPRSKSPRIQLENELHIQSFSEREPEMRKITSIRPMGAKQILVDKLMQQEIKETHNFLFEISIYLREHFHQQTSVSFCDIFRNVEEIYDKQQDTTEQYHENNILPNDILDENDKSKNDQNQTRQSRFSEKEMQTPNFIGKIKPQTKIEPNQIQATHEIQQKLQIYSQFQSQNLDCSKQEIADRTTLSNADIFQGNKPKTTYFPKNQSNIIQDNIDEENFFSSASQIPEILDQGSQFSSQKQKTKKRMIAKSPVSKSPQSNIPSNIKAKQNTKNLKNNESAISQNDANLQKKQIQQMADKFDSLNQTKHISRPFVVQNINNKPDKNQRNKSAINLNKTDINIKSKSITNQPKENKSQILKQKTPESKQEKSKEDVIHMTLDLTHLSQRKPNQDILDKVENQKKREFFQRSKSALDLSIDTLNLSMISNKK